MYLSRILRGDCRSERHHFSFSNASSSLQEQVPSPILISVLSNLSEDGYESSISDYEECIPYGVGKVYMGGRVSISYSEKGLQTTPNTKGVESILL